MYASAASSSSRVAAQGRVDAAAVQESISFLRNYCGGTGGESHVPSQEHSSNAKSLAKSPAAAWRADAQPVSYATPASTKRRSSPVSTEFRADRASFLDALNVLRLRYATNKGGEMLDGLESMTADDVDSLVECFRSDLEAAVAAAKERPGKRPIPSGQSLAHKQASATQKERPRTEKGIFVKSVTNVRDAMVVLRAGAEMVKFSARLGTPGDRTVRVLDRRAVHEGEMVLMPHLCWSCDASAEPSNQLPLIQLQDVRTGPPRRASKDENGFVVDPSGEPISDERCFQAVFPQRTLDLAAPSERVADLWVRCLLLVLDKNRSIARRLQRR